MIATTTDGRNGKIGTQNVYIAISDGKSYGVFGHAELEEAVPERMR